MRITKIVNIALITVFLASTATSAYAKPLVSVHYDLKKPLKPPTASVNIGKTTTTAGPAGTTITSSGTGEGDKILNKTAGPQTAGNKAADDSADTAGKGFKDTGNTINKGVDDAGRGVGHFFNQVGMAWANFKNDVMKKAEAAAKPWIDAGLHYLILAGIGLVGLITILPVMASYLTVRLMRHA
jgi:hypothetical protein